MGVQDTTFKITEYVEFTDKTIILTPDVYNITITSSINNILNSWDKLSTVISNPIINLFTEFFNVIITWYNNIFDFISIFFLLNFWMISFLIFIQGWELLINYTYYFNNKIVNNNKSVHIINTKLNNNIKILIQYYL